MSIKLRKVWLMTVKTMKLIVSLCKALSFTSNLPGDLYTPAECIEQVEYFTQKIQKKFNSEYGPDIHNERL